MAPMTICRNNRGGEHERKSATGFGDPLSWLRRFLPSPGSSARPLARKRVSDALYTDPDACA